MTWSVNVYYDYLDDRNCLSTTYKFKDRNIAIDFEKEMEDQEWLFVSEPFETPKVHPAFKKDGERPVFCSVEEALEDLKDFQNHRTYKYFQNVYHRTLEELELMILRKENTKLKEALQKALGK